MIFNNIKREKIFIGYLCELSPELSCTLYIGLLWNIIHSGHNFCAKRIHIVGSETFEGLFCENILRD